MTFPLQIRQLRRALDLTQAECAAILDVCPQSICNWEAGRSLPWEKDREGYLATLRNGHNRSMGYGDTATINSDKLRQTATNSDKPRQRRRIGDML